MKRQPFLLLFITSAIAWSLVACGSTQPVFKTVDAAHAGPLAAKRNIVVLDVRTPAEYSEGHLPNAINIDYLDPSFADKIRELNKKKKYLVYCRSGKRSTQALELMKQQNFKNVTNMLGGMLQWQGLVVSQ
jgi:rhodanese-related sulfurtransferase